MYFFIFANEIVPVKFELNDQIQLSLNNLNKIEVKGDICYAKICEGNLVVGYKPENSNMYDIKIMNVNTG